MRRYVGSGRHRPSVPKTIWEKLRECGHFVNVLIIDDAPDFRALAAHFVKIEWPDASITQYDPVALGRPGGDFGWKRFDVVLLDFMLGIEDGLE